APGLPPSNHFGTDMLFVTKPWTTPKSSVKAGPCCHDTRSRAEEGPEHETQLRATRSSTSDSTMLLLCTYADAQPPPHWPRRRTYTLGPVRSLRPSSLASGGNCPEPVSDSSPGSPCHTW